MGERGLERRKRSMAAREMRDQVGRLEPARKETIEEFSGSSGGVNWNTKYQNTLPDYDEFVRPDTSRDRLTAALHGIMDLLNRKIDPKEVTAGTIFTKPKD
ncbi:hypothetical protein ACH5RR_015454 [Cinchona calisaya]|uniref:Uncharacterized protein n=1 Tax=Cinchona calisaya TaxID=153742 RepID=A0ABD2ZT62_9GENT